MTSPIPRLVGMVHLLALPGSPLYRGSMDEVITTAAEDAKVLVKAGFPALIVENFGDVPYHADRVAPETVAAMTLAVREVISTGVTVGVNILRNDALSALGVAAATGARFIRVNVLTGVMYTDQGPITGRADEIMRKRAALCPDVEVWADVMVKHSTPPYGMDAAQATLDTVERGLADAVIVSGSGTGTEPDLEEARAVRAVLPEGTRLAVGSGASVENLDALLSAVDTVIVGSSLKFDGDANKRPDRLRAEAFVEAAADRGLI
ncbi:MAG TPA: BtpA/SgcQ family protein [Acidimicrobiia bacterium]|nr:BtpA/SgcQ family protein [Acidimicrobiia bacterium]